MTTAIRPVKAIDSWKNNAELIADVASLGYLNGKVCDLTYGKGRFWKTFQPKELIGCDINPKKSPIGYSVDFCNTPFDDNEFDTTVLDPPYRLNGTPDQASDVDYGTEQVVKWQDRITQINDGTLEALRITKPKGYFLLKCQDQVSSGRVRWQTFDFKNFVEYNGAVLEDMFHFPSYRKQPGGRKQVHARRNYSTLLVFRKK